MVRRKHQFRVTSRCMSLGVRDLGGRNVDVVPPGAPESIAEVDVLHVHEVSGIESVDGVERSTAKKQAGPGKPSDGPLTDRLVLLAVALRPRFVGQTVPSSAWPAPDDNVGTVRADG